jgi:DNA-binding CsgD family transcriptional regulator
MERETQTRDDRLSLLSAREREVLERIARGMTNAQVAADLLVTTHAVKFHLAAIYRKLGVVNRTQAAARYLTLTGGTNLISERGA